MGTRLYYHLLFLLQFYVNDMIRIAPASYSHPKTISYRPCVGRYGLSRLLVRHIDDRVSYPAWIGIPYVPFATASYIPSDVVSSSVWALALCILSLLSE